MSLSDTKHPPRKLWFGKLPSHWDAIRTKVIFRNARDRKHENDEQLSSTQKYGVIPQRLYMEHEDTRVMLALSGTENFKHVDRDDFVISLRSFEGGLERCFYDGCVSPAYTVMKSNVEINPTYFQYLFKSTQFIQEMQLGVYGIRDGKAVNFEDIAKIQLPFPPIVEQKNIAAYLDFETKRVEGLIKEKHRLLEKLDELKTVTIKDLVHSEGEVWKVSHAFRLGSGTTPPSAEDQWYAGDTPWVQTSELRENVIVSTEKRVSDEAVANFSALKVYPAGTLMVAMYGATIGRLGILGVDAACNQACCALISDGQVLPEFLFWWLFANKHELLLRASGGTQPNISSTVIANLRFKAPNVSEQKNRVELINREVKQIDRFIEHVRDEIKVLKEFYSATITDAVLGRVDVRQVAEKQ